PIPSVYIERNDPANDWITMQDSVQVVFGATGASGAALCTRLAAGGAQVIAVGRDEQKLSELGSTGVVARTVLADCTEFGSVEAAVSETVADFGRIDGVANMVGSLLLKPAHTTSAEDWQRVIEVNLTSAFAVLRAAAKVMSRAEQGGAVVLVSSAAARTGLANHDAIAAAKAGVIGLTLSAASTYGPRGVRVNAVAPGLVETPMTERIWSSAASLAASVGMHALGKIGQPDDVAAAIYFLLDPANGWITGQVLGVDGGLGTVRAR
ncbi:MAG: SDR family oxidoreductase, partial [Candidatus Nanopelagicales bacterium]